MLQEDKEGEMEDEPGEKKETYDDVKAEVAEPEAPEEHDVPEVPVPKAKAKPKAEPKAVAKPSKQDKIECADCGKMMTANSLRYKHVCKVPKSDEIQKEKPRRKPKPESSDEDSDKENIPPKKAKIFSPTSPRQKMVDYYRQAKVAHLEAKRAKFRDWLGN